MQYALLLAQEPMQTALRHIVELEFDKFELALVEGGQHLQLSEAGDDPDARLADSAGPEPDSVRASSRLRRPGVVRSCDGQAI